MKKFIWGGLFAFVFMAGVLTSFLPTAAETCCKKTCDHGEGQGKAWRENHKNAAACCKKSSCEKA